MVHTFKLSYSGGVQQVFFHGNVLVKGILCSNVIEASLAESFFYPWDYNLLPFSVNSVVWLRNEAALGKGRTLYN